MNQLIENDGNTVRLMDNKRTRDTTYVYKMVKFYLYYLNTSLKRTVLRSIAENGRSCIYLDYKG